MKSTELLSIIIPVYNEEKTISKIIEHVVKSKTSIDKEIILIDDCSSDNSRIEIEKTIKKLNNKNISFFCHNVNQGKGAALKTGFKHANGTIIGIQDADLEYNPNEYQKLINPLLKEGYKIVYGSRFLNNYEHKKNKFYFANKFLSLLTSVLYFRKVSDMETCYKFFRKEVIKNMDIKSNCFDFEPEFTSKLMKSGYKIKEVPISYNPRTKEEGKKIGFKDGFIAVYTLFKYRF